MHLSFPATMNQAFLNEVPGAHLAPPVPMPVVALLSQLVVERGVPQATLLRMSGLDAAVLADPEALLPAADYATLIYHVLELTGDPCFGIELGMHIPPTLFGFLGLALMCADTLQDACELGVRYAPLGSRFIDILPAREDEGVRLTFKEKMPLGFARQFAIESTIAAWLNCAQHLGGPGAHEGHVRLARIQLDWPRPEAFVRYEKCWPKATFGAASNELFIPHELLATRLSMAQPLAARQARAQCEQELAKVRLSEESFSAAVADALYLSTDGFPSLPQVAERMNLSTRTLARRLERQGVNFRDVVNERRRLEALRMLRSSPMRIDDIALKLGYLNPANFTRAFKRWTGETPSAYRQRFQLSTMAD